MFSTTRPDKLCSVPPDRTRVRTDCKFWKLNCCFSCTYCSWAATKERHKSSYCKTMSVIKICEQCFLYRSIVFCKTCTKCCTKSARLNQFWKIWEALGAGSKVVQMLKTIGFLQLAIFGPKTKQQMETYTRPE